jgi:uncharacterized protein involved in exopolysaccharide biosynthesis
LKPIGGIESSVQTLQDIEVSPGNGIESRANGSHLNNLDNAWLLWGNRRRLRRITLSGLILATILAFIMRNSYTSVTRLMPPERESSTSPLFMMAAMASGGSGGGSGGSGSSLGDVASDILGTKSEGALVVEIMQSRSVADVLIQRFDLRSVYKVKYWEDARQRLKSHTDIAEDKKSGVIVISVKDHDPKRAAQMAQAYVEALNDLLAAVSTSSARRERVFIEARLKTVKQELDRAEREFSDYASKNTAIDIPEQGKAMVAAAAILQGQLIAAQSEVEALSQVYTASNVRVRSGQARVAELQKQLEKMGGESASLTAIPKEGLGDSYSSDLYPSIRKLPLLGVRWADLYRESKIEETVYELLTGQYEMAKIQEAKEVPSVQAYDVGEVPEKTSNIPRLFIMVIGAILSFGMGSAWILGTAAWQRLDQRDPRKQLIETVGQETWVPLFQSAARVRKQIAIRLPKWPLNGHATRDVEGPE